MKTHCYTTLERPGLGLLAAACLALAPCACTAAEPEGDSHFLDLRRLPDAAAATTETGSVDLQLRTPTTRRAIGLDAIAHAGPLAADGQGGAIQLVNGRELL